MDGRSSALHPQRNSVHPRDLSPEGGLRRVTAGPLVALAPRRRAGWPGKSGQVGDAQGKRLRWGAAATVAPFSPMHYVSRPCIADLHRITEPSPIFVLIRATLV